MSAATPAPISARHLAACLFVGSLGLLILGVQPVLLAPLVEEGRIVDSQVGNLVTVEMIMMAVGSLFGLRLLRSAPARWVTVGAGIALALFNAAMIARSGLSIILPMRAAAGIAEGILVSTALVAIARTIEAERASALFLAAQTLMQLVAAAIMPLLTLGGSRVDAGLLLLAGAGITAALAAMAIPRRLEPAEPDGKGGALTVRSGAALLSAALFLGAIVAIWGYFGLWLARHGHPPALEGIAVSVSLGFQVLGALVAARIGDRLPNAPTIAFCAFAQIAVVGLLWLLSGSTAAIVILSALFGFLWLFALPSFTGWLIEIDPHRRAVLYLTAVELGGAALLPSLAGPFVGGWGVDMVMIFGSSTFVGVVLIALFVKASSRRQSGA